MNKMDLKFNKIVSVFLVNRTFSTERLFDSLSVYLRHTLNSKPWNKD